MDHHHEGHGEHNHGDIELWKGLSIGIIIVVAVLGAAVFPLLLKKRSVELVFGDSMAAGVLLVVAVMHLLPEAELGFKQVAEANHDPGHHVDHDHGSHGDHEEHAPSIAGAICVGTYILLILIQEIALKLWMPKEKTPDGENKVDPQRVEEGCVAQAGAHNPDPTAGSLIDAPDTPAPVKTPSVVSPCGHAHSPSDDREGSTLTVSAACLFLALGIHCFVEGFTLGAQTELSTLKLILISICAHKGFAGFALGQTLLQAKYSMKLFSVLVSAFVLFTPMGVGIGWAANVAKDFSNKHAAIHVATSVAAGTFLSVATYEILPVVFRKKGKFWQKVVGLVLGGGAMMTVLLAVPHEH